MKKFLSPFLSMGFMTILLLIFAFACAVATIVESANGTESAWAYIYGTDWFGLIMLLLVINLSYNIYKFKLYDIKKLPSFVFHLSFIVIFIGALITRYFGMEGSLHIRQGESSNIISSREIYTQLIAEDDNGKIVSKDRQKFIAKGEENSFSLDLDLGKKTATLSYKHIIPHASIGWREDKSGEAIVELIFSDEKNKNTLTLMDGMIVPISDLDITFNKEATQDEYLEIWLKNGEFFIKTNQNIEYTKMGDLSKTTLPKDEEIPFENGVYTLVNDRINFAPKNLLAKAKLGVKEVPQREPGNEVMMAELSYNGESKEVFMFFGSFPRKFSVGGREFSVAWGPKSFELPFSMYLEEFKLDRYPGSNSPSGYSSQVIVQDGDIKESHKIYMNNVLDYGGYRFFQSSYDKDELGTILSVNKDPGKFPTYFGYFLLMVGMFLNFFNKNSRFLKLARMIDESSSRTRVDISKTGKNKKAVKI